MKTLSRFPYPRLRTAVEMAGVGNESVGCLDLNLAFWDVPDADNLTFKPQRELVPQWSSDP